MEAMFSSDVIITIYETTHFYPEDGGNVFPPRMVTTSHT
jgi:hypothetical protein